MEYESSTWIKLGALLIILGACFLAVIKKAKRKKELAEQAKTKAETQIPQ